MEPQWWDDVLSCRRLMPWQFGRQTSSLGSVLSDKGKVRVLTVPQGFMQPTACDILTYQPACCLSPGGDSSWQKLGEDFLVWDAQCPKQNLAWTTHPVNDLRPELHQSWVWNSRRLWLVEMLRRKKKAVLGAVTKYHRLVGLSNKNWCFFFSIYLFK